MRIVDPTFTPEVHEKTMAPRNRSLAGATLGLLDNSKVNSAELLRMVAGLLQERFGVQGVIAWGKGRGRGGGVAPPELLDEIAKRCHFAITAIGD